MSTHIDTEFLPVISYNLHNHNKIWMSYCILLLRSILELILFSILGISSIGFSVLLAFITCDYRRNKLILWFIFMSLITSCLIYFMYSICRMRGYQTPTQIRKLTRIRIVILFMETLLIFFGYQWIGSSVAPDLSIWPNLYSTSISTEILPYNHSFAVAKKFFNTDCLRLNFEEIGIRDISNSWFVKRYITSRKDFNTVAYINRATIYSVIPNYIISTETIIHELTHSWQHQNGIFDGIKGLKILLGITNVKQSMYDYGNLTEAINNKKHFLDFGVEQQATIIQHYYWYLYRQSINCSYYDCNNLQNSLEFYASQSVLRAC